MLRNILIAFFFVIGIGSASAQNEIKCYSNEEFLKLVDEKNLITMFNGFPIADKVNEIMLSTDRRVYLVEYVKSDNGNAKEAKEYCVTRILDNVVFNDTAIELLSKMLEKFRGQKT